MKNNPLNNNKGSVMILLALIMTGLLGMTALVVDVGTVMIENKSLKLQLTLPPLPVHRICQILI